MASLNQTTVLLDLSYLLGESSVPSSGTEDRKRFIQLALERCYRAYDFPFNKVTATIPLVGGIATLPTNVHQDSVIDIREVVAGVGNDKVYSVTPYGMLDDYSSGQHRYALTGYEGNYIITTSETTDTTLQLYYETTAPVINGSVSTPFPSSTALARGALVYYRQAEDPQADISQEEYLFQQELDEVISQYNRSRPQPRAVTLHEASGTYPGDITDTGAFIGPNNSN